jgi:hypothetical protein
VVLNQTYKVEWLASSDDQGRCDPDLCVIQITKGQPPKALAATLLHELIHAVNFAMGVTDKTTEEDATGKQETGLSTVWVNNPKLFEWLHKQFTK